MAEAAAGHRLLSIAALSVVSAPHGDVQLQLIADTIHRRHLVEDLADLGRVLERELASGPRHLELVGHTMDGDGVLVLGATRLTAADPAVIGFFAELRARLAELGITSIRLLGCGTASHADGQAAIGAIASVAGVPVLGTIAPLTATAYGPDGLRDEISAVYLTEAPYVPAQRAPRK